MSEHHISEAQAGTRFDHWCREHLTGVPRAMLHKLIRKGALRVNRKKPELSALLQAGDTIYVSDALNLTPPVARGAAPRVPLSDVITEETRAMLLHRDAHALVLAKPAGLAVQGGSGVRDCIDHRLDALIDEDTGERPRLVHRLDRDTSGVLLLARTAADAAMLTAAFRERRTAKLYWALVAGVPEHPVGTIDLPLIKRLQGSVEKMSVAVPEPEEEPNGQEALTEYRVVASCPRGRVSWLELRPVTGRTHQLRVHLSAIGHPIYGDGKYGGKAAFPELRGGIVLARQLHLHARRLILRQDRYRLDVTAPLPPHMREAWKALSFPQRDEGVSLLELMD